MPFVEVRDPRFNQQAVVDILGARYTYQFPARSIPCKQKHAKTSVIVWFVSCELRSWSCLRVFIMFASEQNGISAREVGSFSPSLCSEPWAGDVG